MNKNFFITVWLIIIVLLTFGAVLSTAAQESSSYSDEGMYFIDSLSTSTIEVYVDYDQSDGFTIWMWDTLTFSWSSSNNLALTNVNRKQVIAILAKE